MLRVHMDPMLLCPGKGPCFTQKPKVDQIATNVENPNLCKSLRSGDLLSSALQTESFLLANTFLDSSVTSSFLNRSILLAVIISEPDLLSTLESEILEGFSDQERDSSQEELQ
ncbi:hypothetical protein TNCV_2421161 [Trichonephila clavipes]|nr:hypothetical protein TNCV_2421161 [Trichonephila clavipes]